MLANRSAFNDKVVKGTMQTEVQWFHCPLEFILCDLRGVQVRAWDAATGLQVKKMAEHDMFVNTCCPLRRGPPLLVSGSDDGTAKV